MPDIHDKLGDELDAEQRTAGERTPLIEPNADEIRNGWTAEALTTYVAERNAGAEVKVDPRSLHRRVARRPRAQNTDYDPFRWR